MLCCYVQRFYLTREIHRYTTLFDGHYFNSIVFLFICFYSFHGLSKNALP